jgi:hypothetical protein
MCVLFTVVVVVRCLQGGGVERQALLLHESSALLSEACGSVWSTAALLDDVADLARMDQGNLLQVGWA